MDTSVDSDRLGQLVVESRDLHSDSMRESRPKLSDYAAAVRDGGDERRRSLGAGDVGDDIAVLRTAASLEILAVSAYRVALALPFIGGSTANPTIRSFVGMTMAQHSEHAEAFNAAAVQAGGKSQTVADPIYAAVVAKAGPTLTTPGAVVDLAITLEDVAAQTYVRDAALVSTAALRTLFISVAAVEAQHRAILLAVRALVKAGAPELIRLGPPTDNLPASVGSVGFPTGFYPTTMASPAAEGSA